MAHIINLENNLKLEINFIKNHLFDYDIQRNDYENWIPYTFNLTLPNRNIMIDESCNATMTVNEIKNLTYGIKNILEELENKSRFTFEFYNSEGFFGLKLEIVPEDFIVEIEVWINIGNQTKGVICGYDEGIRFVSNKKMLTDFFIGIKNEMFWDSDCYLGLKSG